MTALPQPVGDALEIFVAAARVSLGDSLRSIVLYGSAAEGRLRSTSDVNVIVVLHRLEKEAVDGIREAYRTAQAAIGLTAMFLLETEIEDAAHDFAQKFADILRRRRVIHGDDPFAGLTIPRDVLVRRLRQVLLNLTLRLRESYVERSLREEQCAVAVAEAAGPLRSAAASILELESGEVLSPREALEKIVSSLRRPGLATLLPHMSHARETRVLPAGQGARILFTTIELAQALHERAHRL